MRRKFLSVLLALSMVLTLVPVTALAVDTLTITAGSGFTKDTETNAQTVEYSASTKEVTLTVEKPASLSPGTTNGFTVTCEGVADNKITDVNFSSDSATVKMDIAGLAAGDHTVTATVTPDSPGEAQTATFDFTVLPKELTVTNDVITVPTDAGLNYTGAAIDATKVEIKDGLDTLVEDTDYTVTYAPEAHKNVGEVTVTVSPVDGSNYTFDEVTKNFTIAAVEPTSITVKVGDADVKLFGTSAATEIQLPEGGLDVAPVATITGVTVEGTAETGDTVGTFAWSGSTNWKNPTQDQTVAWTFTAKANGNYKAMSNGGGSITVKPPKQKTAITITAEAKGTTTSTYSGTALDAASLLTVTAKDERDNTVTDPAPTYAYTWEKKDGNTWTAVEAAAVKDAGTYRVTVSLASGDTNYTAAAATPVQFTINKKELTVTPALAEAGPVDFDPTHATSRDVAIKGTVTTGIAGTTVTLDPITVQITDAYVGMHTITVSSDTDFVLKTADQKNFTLADTDFTGLGQLTIQAINQPITLDTSATVNKGGETVDLTDFVSGAVLGTDANAKTLKFAITPTTGFTCTEAGSLTVTNEATAKTIAVTVTLEGVDVGTVSGEVTAAPEYSVYSGTLNVTVIDTSIPTPQLSFAESAISKKTGDAEFTNALTVTMTGEGAADIDADTVKGTATYVSSNTSVATVDNVTNKGEVTIVAAGTTTITATIAASDATGNEYNGAVKSYTLTVTAPVSVTGVTLNKSATSIAVGGTETLQATVKPDNADDKTVTWSSDAPSVATVTNGVVTAVAEGTAIITATAGGQTASCTVTVTPATSPGGGSHGSGGSGGGGGSTSSTVTVPVSGDDNSVEVSAKVSGSTATIDKIDGLDKVLDSDADTGVVEIDLTALKKDIDTVSISASSIEDIAKAAADSDNDVDGLAVKLDSGTVEFDADALEAIVDQATSSSIQLVLEKTNSSDLNSSQREAVKDMDIHGHFDLTLTGGKVITDFKGGRVSVRIPFTVPSGKDAANFVVIFVANDGAVEEMRTSCSGGYISFTTDHFSKYLIAYKDSEPVEPAENTPVTADCDGGGSCPAHKFTDVDTSLWYHKAVDYVITNGLMSGVGENSFSPNANLSRAMLAQILYNQAGRPAVTGSSDFNDVAEGMWYTNAIVWAAENGVVSGLGNGKFGPNDNITREQLAVMLYRYAGSPAADGSLSGFADADKASGYAQNALVWATDNGVMSGKGGGMLDPQGLATRAEVAQMLYNYLNK